MGNTVIIGPRSSGKTTYLAGLSYLPELISRKNKKNKFKIQPLNEDAIQLQKKAENLIRQGISLEGTEPGNVFELPTYSFQIEFKKESITLVVKDYAGEIFEALDSPSMDKKHEEYWEECFMKDKEGCLLLLTEWQEHNDREYSQKIKSFTKLLDYYKRNRDFRVAVAMSKCERGELWPGRIEPDIDIFEAHLPKTKSVLQENIAPENLEFYALSTFGTIDAHRDPRPNRIDEAGTEGKASILREIDNWKPHNIIAPIYWLNTGKKIDAHVY